MELEKNLHFSTQKIVWRKPKPRLQYFVMTNQQIPSKGRRTDCTYKGLIQDLIAGISNPNRGSMGRRLVPGGATQRGLARAYRVPRACTWALCYRSGRQRAVSAWDSRTLSQVHVKDRAVGLRWALHLGQGERSTESAASNFIMGFFPQAEFSPDL